jgi:hypothetical protein
MNLMSKMKKEATTKPVKFAKGKEVKVTRGGVYQGIGRYHMSVEKANGVWHLVNMAAKGQKVPDVRAYRAANLERA